jgi:hypothetical protein
LTRGNASRTQRRNQFDAQQCINRNEPSLQAGLPANVGDNTNQPLQKLDGEFLRDHASQRGADPGQAVQEATDYFHQRGWDVETGPFQPPPYT